MTLGDSLARADEWSDAEFFANIAKVFDTLMELRGVSPDELAAALEISRSTVYNKLASGKFTAIEIRRATRLLRVRPEAFYQPADSLLSDSVSRWSSDSPDLTSVDTHIDDDPFQLRLTFDRPKLSLLTTT